MTIPGYSYNVSKEEKELHAFARAEDIDASYKDLGQVCARIRGKPTKWAMEFLEKASREEIPVLYKTHNKKLGHRRQLGGKKGRYPKKAAAMVLKVLKSAIANGNVLGLSDDMLIRHASANKKHTYPRMASKGRSARANYETARVEIIVQAKERKVEKKIEVKKPEAKAQEKVEVKQAEKKTDAKPEEKKHEVKIVETAKTEQKHPQQKEKVETKVK